MNKKNKGITLVALVITIIILLILAGVSITSLTTENGILGKAKNASNDTNKANAKEKVQMLLLDYGIEKYTSTGALATYLNEKKIMEKLMMSQIMEVEILMWK